MFFDPELLSEAATVLLSHGDRGALDRSQVTVAVEQVWLAWIEMKRYGEHPGPCDAIVGLGGSCSKHMIAMADRQAALDAAVGRLRALMMVGSPGVPENAGMATSKTADSTGAVVSEVGPDRQPAP